MVHITGFNEWHEDTEIEPTIVTAPSTDDDSPTGSPMAWCIKGLAPRIWMSCGARLRPPIPIDGCRDAGLEPEKSGPTLSNPEALATGEGFLRS
jgi:hypothetical protein